MGIREQSMSYYIPVSTLVKGELKKVLSLMKENKCTNEQVQQCMFSYSLDIDSKEFIKLFALFCDVLKENHSITHLDLSSVKNLKDNEYLKILASTLKANNAITTLSLQNCNLDDENAKIIATILENNKNITTLNLGNIHGGQPNTFSTEGIKNIVSALKDNPTPVSLDFQFIEKESPDRFAEFIELRSEKVKVFASALEQNYQGLVGLSLQRNQLGNDNAKILASALKRNTTLRSLQLGVNNLGNEGAKTIADALTENKSLRELNLEYNGIEREGAKVIASLLEKSGSLTSLDVGYNEIDNEGVTAIARALVSNRTLEVLSLRVNSIDSKCAMDIASMLSKNQTLKTLDLGSNPMGDQGAKVIASGLEINRSLLRLELWYNDINTNGCEALAGTLKKNTTLTHLNLSHNCGDKSSTKSFASALDQNNSLLLLDLRCRVWIDMNERSRADVFRFDVEKRRGLLKPIDLGPMAGCDWKVIATGKDRSSWQALDSQAIDSEGVKVFQPLLQKKPKLKILT